MMEHFKMVCKICNKVMAQCRCMDCNKTIKYSVCMACSDKEMDKVKSEPMNRKESICTVCGEPKAPCGRSLPPYYADSHCTFECEGYYKDPQPSCLFIGEAGE